MISRFKCLTVILYFIFALFLSCKQENANDPISNSQNSAADNNKKPEDGRRDLSLADSLFKQGRTLFLQSKFDSAKVLFEKAAALFKARAEATDSLKTWEKYMRSRAQIAFSLHRMGQSDEVIAIGKELLSFGLAKFGKINGEVARAYDLLGVAYLRKGLYDSAMFYQKETLPIRLRVYGKTHEEVAKSYINMGIIYQNTSKLDSALAVYKKGLEIQVATIGEHHLHTAFSHNNIGLIHAYKSNNRNALAAYEKALAISKQLKNNWLTEIVLNNIALIHLNDGDFDKALLIYEHLLSLLDEMESKDPAYMARVRANLAVAYMGKLEYEKAKSELNKALDIWEASVGPDHPTASVVYMHLGNIYSEDDKDYDAALASYSKALKIRLKTLGENHREVAEIYHNMGNCYRLKGLLQEADARYRKALGIAKKSFGDKHYQLGAAYQRLGDVRLNQNQFEQAFSFYQKALQALVYDFEDDDFRANPSLENIVSGRYLNRALDAKARAFAKRRHTRRTGSEKAADLEMALETYELSIDLLDKRRRGFTNENAKLLLGESAVQVYEEAIQTALALCELNGEPEFTRKAFAVAEKSKNGALLQAVQKANALRFAGLPDSLLREEWQLRVDLAYYATQLETERQKQEDPDSLKYEQLRSQVFSLKQRYDALQEQFEKNYPKYYALQYQNRVALIPEIQNALDAQTVLLEYFVGDEDIYIFAVDKQEIEIFEIPREEQLERRVRALISEISSVDAPLNQAYLKNAGLLYKTLLKPAEAKIAGKNLLIIPDGVLNFLPFEALLTGTAELKSADDFPGLPYLLKKHAVSYAYSAALWLESRESAQQPPKKDYLAFAPVFPEGAEAKTRGGNLFASLAFPDDSRSSLGFLEASREEIESVRKLFNESYGWYDRRFGGKIKTYFESEATEQRVKAENLRDFKYVHFATHGFANEAAPDLSWLMFSDDSTSTEDGLMHLGELYNLEMNADLVVLSACETGVGKLAHGEGLLGLARGFIYAGARNLLVSLWQVNDASTAKLMRLFYQNMLSGMSKPEALQKAKLQLMEENEFHAMPYHWAPFVLIGS